jgi:hypothetical protein
MNSTYELPVEPWPAMKLRAARDRTGPLLLLAPPLPPEPPVVEEAVELTSLDDEPPPFADRTDTVDVERGRILGDAKDATDVGTEDTATAETAAVRACNCSFPFGETSPAEEVEDEMIEEPETELAVD